MKVPLLGISPKELQSLLIQWEAAPELALKIARWLYRRDVFQFNDMNDISREVRTWLEQHFLPGNYPFSERVESRDGSVKYRFQAGVGRAFEAVYLPEGTRHTLCLSIQSGCRMGCRFCRTARLGFNGNLEVHEILNQLYSIREKKLINHIVFMGMGEPMDNYENLIKCIEILTAEWGFAIAYRNITVSTVGINPGLKNFLRDNRCNLALSLHSPFEEERSSLIPAERVFPFRELLIQMKSYTPARKRRITVQYTLIGGVNDSEEHMLELISLLNGSHLKLNIISFNPFPGCNFVAPAHETIDRFMRAMNKAGIYATVRKSRGEDIGAACGMLGN